MRATFASGDLNLEGELTLPGSCSRGAVICHPHPQYGGDMDDPVVCAVARALQEAGHATLRFNFRGVGASTGRYGGGAGEGDDLRAAVRFLIERSGASRVTLAGYSFGAMIALQVGPDVPQVDQLIAVAPPLSFFGLDGIAACTKEKLFVVG
jgi:alpha/beta superfamily hydrolase